MASPWRFCTLDKGKPERGAEPTRSERRRSPPRTPRASTLPPGACRQPPTHFLIARESEAVPSQDPGQRHEKQMSLTRGAREPPGNPRQDPGSGQTRPGRPTRNAQGSGGGALTAGAAPRAGARCDPCPLASDPAPRAQTARRSPPKKLPKPSDLSQLHLLARSSPTGHPWAQDEGGQGREVSGGGVRVGISGIPREVDLGTGHLSPGCKVPLPPLLQ